MCAPCQPLWTALKEHVQIVRYNRPGDVAPTVGIGLILAGRNGQGQEARLTVLAVLLPIFAFTDAGSLSS